MTQPTAAAVRAAQQLARLDTIGQHPHRTAASLIDSEFADVVAALRALIDSPNAKSSDMWDGARAALAKLDG